jgi:hypothetical protein
MIRLYLAAYTAALAALVVLIIQLTRPPTQDGLTLVGLLLSFIVLGCAAAIYHHEHPEETE